MGKTGKIMRVIAIILTVLLVGGCAIQFFLSIGSTLELLGNAMELLGKFLTSFREYYLENAMEMMKYFFESIFTMALGYIQNSLIYVLYGCILYSLGVIIDRIKPAIKE